MAWPWHTHARPRPDAGTLPNTTTLVFSPPTTIPTSSHHPPVASSSNWRPSGESETRQTSSAYSRSGTRPPLRMRCPSLGQSACRWRCRPSMNNPKRVGLRGHPCFTPRREGTEGPHRPSTFIVIAELAYKDWTAPNKAPWTPKRHRAAHSRVLGTLSYAPFKSRKQQ